MYLQQHFISIPFMRQFIVQSIPCSNNNVVVLYYYSPYICVQFVTKQHRLFTMGPTTTIPRVVVNQEVGVRTHDLRHLSLTSWNLSTNKMSSFNITCAMSSDLLVHPVVQLRTTNVHITQQINNVIFWNPGH